MSAPTHSPPAISAKEFHTAAVIDHEKLRMYAARGLIGPASTASTDIDRVVELIEQRGIRSAANTPPWWSASPARKSASPTPANPHRGESHAALGSRRQAQQRSDASGASGRDQCLRPRLRERSGPRSRQKAAIYALPAGRTDSAHRRRRRRQDHPAQTLVVAGISGRSFSPQAAGRSSASAIAWRQAHALRDSGIRRDLRHINLPPAGESGAIQLSENTVLVIDEISQIAPRPFLKLLELQAQHGFAIKGLGDREQVQAIEAGDTIEILRRVLPKASFPTLLTTIRQETARGREIAGLFREGKAAEALAMKREDGTAMLVGGDQGQVVDRIAELYLRGGISCWAPATGAASPSRR